MYDYKVIPAPSRGEKGKGVKGPEARFALSLERVMNAQAAEGWEFLRSETLPSEERSGLTQTVTQWRSVLVFRKPQPQAEAHPAPAVVAPVPPQDLPAPAAPIAPTEVSSLDEIKRARAELLGDD